MRRAVRVFNDWTLGARSTVNTNHWEALESSEEYLWCEALELAFWTADSDEESDFYFDWIEAIDVRWAMELNGTAGELI